MCTNRENTSRNLPPGSQIQKIMINDIKFASVGWIFYVIVLWMDM